MKNLLMTGLLLSSIQLSFADTSKLDVLEAQFNANLAIMDAQVSLLEGINNRLSSLHQSLWLSNQEMAISNTRSRLSTSLTETSINLDDLKNTPGLGEQNVLRHIRLANYSLDSLNEWSKKEESGYSEVRGAAYDFETFMKKASRRIEDYTILALSKPEVFPLSDDFKEIISHYNKTILRGYEIYQNLEAVDKEPRFWLPKDGVTIAENFILMQPKDSEDFQKVLEFSVKSIVNEELKYRSQRSRDEALEYTTNIKDSIKLELFSKLLKSYSSTDLMRLEILNSVEIDNLWEKLAFEIILMDIDDEHLSQELVNLADSIQTEEQLRSFIDIAKNLI